MYFMFVDSTHSFILIIKALKLVQDFKKQIYLVPKYSVQN